MSEALVALLEIPARFGEPEAVLAEVRSLLARPPLPDLVLLPETAITGYVDAVGDFDLSRFAEPISGATVDAIRTIAREVKTTIAAPLVEAEGARRFNAFVVVDSLGEIVAHYRKRHPWYPESWATPGDMPMPRFAIRGLAFTIAICFDVHTLEEEETPLLEAVDALLFPSAWVDDGAVDLRADLLSGIARRRGVTILNANWGKGVPAIRGQGVSRAVGPRGEIARLASRGHAGRLDVVVHRRG